jgi:hypothetical protein
MPAHSQCDGSSSDLASVAQFFHSVSGLQILDTTHSDHDGDMY